MRGFSSLDRQIGALAFPALATLIAEPLYVLTDTAVVGHLGNSQLGGLAVASTVLLTGHSIFIFLAYGTTASVARLLGSGELAKAADQAVQSLWLAGLLGLIVGAAGLVLGPAALSALGAHGAVLSDAWTYLSISLIGVPALMLTLAGTGYLRGLQNTRLPLALTVAGALGNLVLELVLIVGLGFGIGASAAASALVQWLVAVVYMRFVFANARSEGASLAPQPRLIGGQMGVGADLLVRTIALRSSLVVATSVAARMGTVTLAAHQIAFEIWNFLAMAVDAIAIAAQAMIGRLLGSGDSAGARAAAKRMLQWGAVTGIFGLVAVLAVSVPLPRLFTGDAEVAALASTLLVWVAALQPVNSAAFVLDGIVIGAGDTRYMAKAMVLAAALFIPLAVAVHFSSLGVQALWAALGVLMAARVATLWVRFRGDSWVLPGGTVARNSGATT